MHLRGLRCRKEGVRRGLYLEEILSKNYKLQGLIYAKDLQQPERSRGPQGKPTTALNQSISHHLHPHHVYMHPPYTCIHHHPQLPPMGPENFVDHCLFTSFDSMLDKEPRAIRQLRSKNIIPVTEVSDEIKHRIELHDNELNSYPAMVRGKEGVDKFGLIFPNYNALSTDAQNFMLDAAEDKYDLNMEYIEGKQAFISLRSILERSDDPIVMVDDEDLQYFHLDTKQQQQQMVKSPNSYTNTEPAAPAKSSMKKSGMNSKKLGNTSTVGFDSLITLPTNETVNSFMQPSTRQDSSLAASSSATVHNVSHTPAVDASRMISGYSTKQNTTSNADKRSTRGSDRGSEGRTTVCTVSSGLTNPTPTYLSNSSNSHGRGQSEESFKRAEAEAEEEQGEQEEEQQQLICKKKGRPRIPGPSELTLPHEMLVQDAFAFRTTGGRTSARSGSVVGSTTSEAQMSVEDR